jgi:(R,R)-butanediol dehydrogenase / meso-butanediol dehydrogenase / diacetyl reductase
MTKSSLTMRAVRLHGIGDLRFENAAAAGDLPSDHVRVRVRAAGVCGSDLHNFRTGQWMGRLPIIPGHEFAGEILSVGAAVTDLKPGDLVVADSRVSCGECPRCLQGRLNVCDRMGYVGEVCDGAFAEMIDLPARQLLRVPRDVPLNVAALAEPLGVSLRVVRRLDAARNTPIVIAGAGPIGGLAAILLDHLGFGPLALVERNVERAQLVASVTGARIIAPQASEVSDFTGGLGLRYAIEATGSQSMLTFVLSALAGGGRLAMVGLFNGNQSINANAVVERELEIRGCSVFCDEQREALELLPSLRARLERVISPGITLEQLPQEYARLLSGDSRFLKTIVTP